MAQIIIIAAVFTPLAVQVVIEAAKYTIQVVRTVK